MSIFQAGRSDRLRQGGTPGTCRGLWYPLQPRRHQGRGTDGLRQRGADERPGERAARSPPSLQTQKRRRPKRPLPASPSSKSRSIVRQGSGTQQPPCASPAARPGAEMPLRWTAAPWAALHPASGHVARPRHWSRTAEKAQPRLAPLRNLRHSPPSGEEPEHHSTGHGTPARAKPRRLTLLGSRKAAPLSRSLKCTATPPSLFQAALLHTPRSRFERRKLRLAMTTGLSGSLLQAPPLPMRIQKMSRRKNFLTLVALASLRLQSLGLALRQECIYQRVS